MPWWRTENNHNSTSLTRNAIDADSKGDVEEDEGFDSGVGESAENRCHRLPVLGRVAEDTEEQRKTKQDQGRPCASSRRV